MRPAWAVGWDPLDHARVGQGSGIDQLLECGPQVTGGDFADPGFKDVPDVWDLGLPIAEVDPAGSAVITKPPGCSGVVNLMTVKEQIFYEVHDPSNYITPDVVVDFTTADLAEVGPNRVTVSGIGGKPRTPTLKARLREAGDAAMHLRAAFGLTEPSARLVAALLAGNDMRTYAESARISEKTAKFHLRGAFAATGTNRQSDLVRIAGALVRDLGLMRS